MTVLHLHQVSGKSAVSAVDQNGNIQSAWLDDFFSNYFADLIAQNADWPHDAMFKTEVKYHTWPMGWDKDPVIYFFPTQEAMDEYLAELKDWALSEDNEVKVKIWEWDLGPEFKEERHYQ